MKPMSRVLAAVLMLSAGATLAAGATATTTRNPNRLVILSTTDVKGKTGPCG